jgi:hypothetical protein
MATLLIPTTPGVPFYTQKTRLDGVDYVLEFRYSQREDRWYLDISDSEEVPILTGLKLIANWPLLQAYHYDTRVPPGELMAISLVADDSPPGLNELGEGLRCELTYFEKPAPSLVTSVPIFIAVRVTRLGGYVDDPTFALALATACAPLAARGSPITAGGVLSAAASISNATITGLAIGFSAPSPVPTTIVPGTLPIGADQIASFSTGAIQVVSS